MPEQTIEDDEARIGRRNVAALGVADEPRGFGELHEAVQDGLAIDAHRREIGGQPQIVDENRFALQTVGLGAADVDRPCRLGARGERCIDPRFLERLLDHRFGDGLSNGDPAADEVVEHAGIDRLLGAAPREPHSGRATVGDEAVDVSGVGMDTEVACSGALEQKPRRQPESWRDGVTLIAPGRQHTLGGERAGDAVERGRTRGNVVLLRRKGDFVLADFENVGESPQPLRALPVEPPDRLTSDQERLQALVRRRELGGEARANRRYNGGFDHSPF